jgi:hypothetical protein
MTSHVRMLQDMLHRVEYSRVSGPYYIDKCFGGTLIPFTYANGTLDIANIDNFNEYSGNPLLDADIGQYNLPLYKWLGGAGLVQTLGPNCVRYIRNWRSAFTSAPVTHVELYSSGIMTKVQRSSKTVLHSGTAVRVATSPPSGDLYVDGCSDVDYRCTWIFKRPITIKTVEDGTNKYITFSSRIY